MVSTNRPPHRNLRLTRRELNAMNAQHDEYARSEISTLNIHQLHRVDMPIVYRTIQRRSLRIIYRERRALGVRIWNNEALVVFRPPTHPMLQLEMTIRIVLMRLGFNRDVRDVCVRAILPHGTIGNPCVLF